MEELKAIPLVQVLCAFYEGTAEPYQWGILAGCCVYTATVLVVFYLLAAGGSFQRMREQVGEKMGWGGLAWRPLPLPQRQTDRHSSDGQ